MAGSSRWWVCGRGFGPVREHPSRDAAGRRPRGLLRVVPEGGSGVILEDDASARLRAERDSEGADLAQRQLGGISHLGGHGDRLVVSRRADPDEELVWLL